MKRISEKNLRELIRETIEELTAYHGTAMDFDRFNHKKYLNTGCRSQAFGWGTYVSNDPAIGESYAENVGYDKKEAEKRGEKIMEYLYGRIDKYTYEWLNIVCDFNNRPALIADRSRIIDIIEQCKTSMETGKECLNGAYDESQIRIWTNYVNMYNERLSVLINTILPMTYTPSKGMIYTVEIPEDDGSNYLDWYREMKPEEKIRILRGLTKLNRKYLDMMAAHSYVFKGEVYPYIISDNTNNREKVFAYMASQDSMFNSFSGKNMYNWLTRTFGSKKAASLFLLNCCGFIGITYEAGSFWGKPEGAKDDARNYVLFNANDVKIVSKEKV